eukprot:Hpha_TRINITY_DN2859_c0_g1::TRINITY_DN2859_c0_g1_i1::g.171332::m.171332
MLRIVSGSSTRLEQRRSTRRRRSCRRSPSIPKSPAGGGTPPAGHTRWGRVTAAGSQSGRRKRRGRRQRTWRSAISRRRSTNVLSSSPSVSASALAYHGRVALITPTPTLSGSVTTSRGSAPPPRLWRTTARTAPSAPKSPNAGLPHPRARSTGPPPRRANLRADPVPRAAATGHGDQAPGPRSRVQHPGPRSRVQHPAMGTTCGCPPLGHERRASHLDDTRHLDETRCHLDDPGTPIQPSHHETIRSVRRRPPRCYRLSWAGGKHPAVISSPPPPYLFSGRKTKGQVRARLLPLCHSLSLPFNILHCLLAYFPPSPGL